MHLKPPSLFLFGSTGKVSCLLSLASPPWAQSPSLLLPLRGTCSTCLLLSACSACLLCLSSPIAFDVIDPLVLFLEALSSLGFLTQRTLAVPFMSPMWACPFSWIYWVLSQANFSLSSLHGLVVLGGMRVKLHGESLQVSSVQFLPWETD